MTLRVRSNPIPNRAIETDRLSQGLLLWRGGQRLRPVYARCLGPAPVVAQAPSCLVILKIGNLWQPFEGHWRLGRSLPKGCDGRAPDGPAPPTAMARRIIGWLADFFRICPGSNFGTPELTCSFF